MLRPGVWLALHRQGLFTFELSSHESPHWNVEYNYAGKQPIPAAGLSPAGHAALWAAAEDSEENKEDGQVRRILFQFFASFAFLCSNGII